MRPQANASEYIHIHTRPMIHVYVYVHNGAYVANANVLRYALANAMQSALPFSHATGSSIVDVVIVIVDGGDGCWLVPTCTGNA